MLQKKIAITKGIRQLFENLFWDMFDYFLAEVVEGNKVPITLQYACSDVIHISCSLLVKVLRERSAQSYKTQMHEDREWKGLSC